MVCGPGTQLIRGVCEAEESKDLSEGGTPGDCNDLLDNDQDGFTDCEDQGCFSAQSCDADADGFSVGEGDCDDGDPGVSPAGIDGLVADRSCDGRALVGTLLDAELVLVGESAEDYAGYWVSSAGDVNGDGLGDVLVGAYNEDQAGGSAGAAYLLLGGLLSKPDASVLSSADYKILGEGAGDWAGFTVAHGDIDGDGLSDLLVGAYGVQDRGPLTGAAYVLLGRSLGSDPVISLADADYRILGEEQNDFAGYALSSAGDVDGDGLDDILIGASGHDAGGINAGAGYIVLASSLGSERSIDLSGADYKLVGEAPDNWAGYSVSEAGDVDGDGLGDILLGADVDYGGRESHAAYLVLGRSLGGERLIDLSNADYILTGESSYDYASQVSTAGDVDGDGLSDILIGAAGVDFGGPGAGAAYLVLGGSLGAQRTMSLAAADYVFIGESPGDQAGGAVADAGDVDGDGLSDFVIGAHHFRSEYPLQGAAYLVLGGSLGILSEIQLSEVDYRLVGGSAHDYAGASVSGAGDVDGDGLSDVIVGSYRGPDWSGAAYIVTGG